MKKTIAVIAEAIPVVSAVIAYPLIWSDIDSDLARRLIGIALLFAFLGFAVSLICGRLAKGDKNVKILGILDWVATLSVIGLYLLAFFAVSQ